MAPKQQNYSPARKLYPGDGAEYLLARRLRRSALQALLPHCLTVYPQPQHPAQLQNPGVGRTWRTMLRLEALLDACFCKPARTSPLSRLTPPLCTQTFLQGTDETHIVADAPHFLGQSTARPTDGEHMRDRST